MTTFTSTYRLQLNEKFTFSHTEKILSYLHELGIGAIYASPILSARKGSNHGYDVVDHDSINKELGSKDEFRHLSKLAHQKELGWIQDIVPNHMAFDMKNFKLRDVLEKGKSSRWSNFFDINWEHPSPSINGKILVPFLGKFYGECLDSGELKLHFNRNGLTLQYWELYLPVKTSIYESVFTRFQGNLENTLSSDDRDLSLFLGSLYSLSTRVMGSENKIYHIALQTLYRLYESNEAIKAHMDQSIAFYNDTENREYLDQLISAQNYRLAFWKVAASELNYRRFFNINELISIRIERQEVFEEFIRLTGELIEEGLIDGLRFDHIDGLYDPERFLERISVLYPNLYSVVEKILEPEEELSESWPVHGTTGYDFTLRNNSVFCMSSSENAVTRIYSRFTRNKSSFREIYLAKKRLIIDRLMTGDIDNLAHMIKSLAADHPDGRDLTLHGLRRALVEAMTQFSIYRTYAGEDGINAEDAEKIETAISASIETLPDLVYELEWIKKLLHGTSAPESKNLSNDEPYIPQTTNTGIVDFIKRFQQYTGPLTAKGFEDTLYYVYNRMPSLNEVGGAPNLFGISTDEYHSFILKRMENWPCSMNATATHDTKRGEDTRARMNVISEIPDLWEAALKRWSALNRRYQTRTSPGTVIPDRNDEYFLYMTLIGSLPISLMNRERDNEITDNASFIEELSHYRERIIEYALKAVREAKVHTAWIKPDEVYENGYINFVNRILSLEQSPVFLVELINFVRRMFTAGLSNSLGQLLLKLASPGVPDIYQGTELWDFTLVDPDNRRPVDYDLRRKFLAEIRSHSENESAMNEISSMVAKLWENPSNGQIKMWILHRVLNDRRKNPSLYLFGTYSPLESSGPSADRVLGFSRSLNDKDEEANNNSESSKNRIRIAAIRLFTFDRENGSGMTLPCSNTFLHLTPDNQDNVKSEYPNHRWRNILTGEIYNIEDKIALSEIFKTLPVALLEPVYES